jgi:cbb3-type cytochrome oxidase cytochrome c subunit
LKAKKKEEKQMIQFVVNTIIILATWAQIEITKTFFKNHTS